MARFMAFGAFGKEFENVTILFSSRDKIEHVDKSNV
jgi:hypothetical protein